MHINMHNAKLGNYWTYAFMTYLRKYEANVAARIKYLIKSITIKSTVVQ